MDGSSQQRKRFERRNVGADKSPDRTRLTRNKRAHKSRQQAKASTKTASISAYNFAPQIDLAPLECQASDVAVGGGDSEKEDLEWKTAPSWCPWCGFSCKTPEEHLTKYKAQERCIVRATHRKNIWLLKELLEERKTRDDDVMKDETKWRRDLQCALLMAAHHKSTTVAKLLLQAGAQADSQLVHTAVMLGNVDLLTLVDREYTEWDQPAVTQRTPLHMAADWGHIKIVEFLIKKGCNVNAKDSNCTTPLHLAASSVHPGLVEKLIESGANADAMDHKNSLPWVYSLLNDSDHNFKLLFPKDYTTEMLSDGLFRACESGSIKCAKYLISLGADPGCVRSTPRVTTPLLTALEHSVYGMVHFLLKEHGRRLNLNVFDSSGMTCLHHGLQGSNFCSQKFTLTMMVEAGADVNVQLPDGSRKSLLLEYIDEPDKLRWLLDAGTLSNVVSESGLTVLHAAVQSDSRDAVLPVLFENCMDLRLSLIEYEGRTPVMYALQEGHFDTAKYLLLRGCSATGVMNWLNFNSESDQQSNYNTADVKALMKKLVSTPQTLQEACRFSILHKLGQLNQKGSSMDKLPLPRPLRNFLLPDVFACWKEPYLHAHV